MDANRFDGVIRSLTEGRSRRPVLGLLVGGVAGLAPLGYHAVAKKKKKKKVKLCLDGQTISAPKKKKGSFVRRGATVGACTAGPCVGSCAGKACGAGDGCGGTCGCPAGQVCAASVCQTCTVTCSGTPAQCGQALLNEIEDGGTIYVCPGRYANSYWTDRDFTLIGAGQGDNPATSTILEGIDSRRVLTTDFNVDSVIENVRVTRGSTTPGGGITNYGAMTLRRVTVAGHHVATTGGSGAGVRQDGEATGALTLTDCTVTNNSHFTNGGGVSQGSPAHAVTLTNCVVSDNDAALSGAGNGGGVFRLDGAVRITGGRITGNHASAGGGIYASSGGQGSVVLDGVTFGGNTPNNCENVTGCPA